MGRILKFAALMRGWIGSWASLRTVAAIALTAGVVATWADSASAVPAIGCGRITVHHKRYSIRAHVLRCSRARRWSYAFLSNGRVPYGYDCQRFNPRITRVRFVCSNPSTATRSDGPQAFTAAA